MGSVSLELLRSVAANLAGVPIDAGDLTSVAAQLGAQLDGLARLDELDLLAVEPVTVVHPPEEAPDVR